VDNVVKMQPIAVTAEQGRFSTGDERSRVLAAFSANTPARSPWSVSGDFDKPHRLLFGTLAYRWQRLPMTER
jgi:hypothetical protein